MQKTIKINPELFTIGKTDKNNKQKNKSIKNKDINTSSKNDKVKQKLLDKIKNFQKNRQNTADVPNLVEPEINTFNESLAFLDNLSNNYQTQKNKTIKSKNSENSLDVNTNLPEEFSEENLSIDKKSNKSYGCLKNGSLPTFREWKRMTQKNKDIDNNKFKLKINTDNNEYYDNIYTPTFREKKLTEIKAKFKDNNLLSNNSNNLNPISKPYNVINTISSEINPAPSLPVPSTPPAPPAPPAPPTPPAPTIYNKLFESKNIDTENIESNSINDISNNLNNNIVIDEVNVYNIPKILRKTKTLKFKLGRNNKNRKIGIYIKNRETQKNIKNDFNKLKSVDINEVKKYLRKHNLINSGTSSPNDVLRELYEKSILAGDVVNKNTKFLVNNFIDNE
tara:strand:+ start:2677 stop:3855 length:1179 start_codon:yes stop_codon:yes gene_type:complete